MSSVAEVIRALAIYFGWMILSMLLALPLSPATLLAAKAAPPWAVAIVGTIAAGLTATFDHALISRAARLREGDGRIARWLTRLATKVPAAPGAGTRTYGRYVKEVYVRVERLAKVAPFWTTGIFAGVPLPFWIVRLIIPLSGYPLGRYVAAVMIGRFCRLIVLATFGSILSIPTEVLVGLIAFGVASAIVGALVRHFRKPARAAEPPPTSEA
jgi:hypothetical protein